MQATERRRRPLANQFGYVGAFGCRQQIYSILRCNQRDLLFKRGDPFLKHRNLVIDQTGNEGPEFVAGSVATSAANVVATLNAYGLATLCSMRRRDSESWILRSAF